MPLHGSKSPPGAHLAPLAHGVRGRNMIKALLPLAYSAMVAGVAVISIDVEP